MKLHSHQVFHLIDRIKGLWRMRVYNTYEIGKIVSVPESEVYNVACAGQRPDIVRIARHREFLRDR